MQTKTEIGLLPGFKQGIIADFSESEEI